MRSFSDKKAGQYDYSSVQINIPAVIAHQVLRWSEKHVFDEDLYNPPNDKTHGREEDLHVTILYGIHSSLPNTTISLLKECKPFHVKLGKISMFTTNELYDVLKIEVISDKLRSLNKLLKEKLENTQLYDTYRPHVTIAYLKKNKIAKIEDVDVFTGEEWPVKTIIFSSKSGEKTPIRLTS
jgi:2'-5' RNA ligase